MRRPTVLLSLLVIMVVGLVTIGRPGLRGVAQDGTPVAGDQELVGSWIITVQTDGGPSFINLSTFMPGGVQITTAPDGPLGHGVWEPTDEGAYAVTIVFPDFDQDGALKDKVTVRSTVTLSPDGDTFTGPYVTEGKDLTGAVLFSVAGTVQAERIVTEPLGTPVAGTPTS